MSVSSDYKIVTQNVTPDLRQVETKLEATAIEHKAKARYCIIAGVLILVLLFLSQVCLAHYPQRWDSLRVSAYGSIELRGTDTLHWSELAITYYQSGKEYKYRFGELGNHPTVIDTSWGSASFLSSKTLKLYGHRKFASKSNDTFVESLATENNFIKSAFFKLEGKSDGESTTGKQSLQSIITKCLLVIIGLFFAQLSFRLYRYHSKIAVLYQNRKDAVSLFNAMASDVNKQHLSNNITLKDVLAMTSTGKIDFSTPKMPKDDMLELFKGQSDEKKCCCCRKCCC